MLTYDTIVDISLVRSTSRQPRPVGQDESRSAVKWNVLLNGSPLTSLPTRLTEASGPGLLMVCCSAKMSGRDIHISGSVAPVGF